MSGLTLAVVLQTSVLMTTAVSTDSYSAARKDSSESGRPMMILVGAQWCPACVDMKNNVMPVVKRRGLLRRVAFAHVDLDRQQKLGRQLTAGGPIPQLIMYRKTNDGWRRRTLIGGQSVETIASFIRQGVRANESAEKGNAQSRKPAKLQAKKAATPQRAQSI